MLGSGICSTARVVIGVRERNSGEEVLWKGADLEGSSSNYP